MSRTIRRKNVAIKRKGLCLYILNNSENSSHKNWETYYHSDKYNLRHLSKNYKEPIKARHRTDKRIQCHEALTTLMVSFYPSDSDARKRCTTGWGYW